jgi:predicted RND superfamily exporter protein
MVILLMTVAVAGLAAVQLSKLSVTATAQSMFMRYDQIITDYQRFRSQFGRDEEMVLLISSSDIFNLEFLSTLKQFHEDLENSLPLLNVVSSLANASYIESVDSGVRVISQKSFVIPSFIGGFGCQGTQVLNPDT